MAFVLKNFAALSPSGDAPRLFTYRTTDAHTAVAGSGYFNDAYQALTPLGEGGTTAENRRADICIAYSQADNGTVIYTLARSTTAGVVTVVDKVALA